MLITSEIKLEPGKIYTEKDVQNKPFEYMGENFWFYTLYVIRESNKEEYTEYIRNLKPETDFDNFLYFKYFYEISMD